MRGGAGNAEHKEVVVLVPIVKRIKGRRSKVTGDRLFQSRHLPVRGRHMSASTRGTQNMTRYVEGVSRYR